MCFNLKSSTYYFHMKTKILAYFQISLVPFNVDEKVWNFLCLYRSNCLYSQTRGTFEMSQLQQLINEPTHLTGNSSSCINLIFKSQLNLVMESGVHFSLHSSCRHQIVFAEINLNIFYPPPNKHEVSQFNKTDTNLIRRSVQEFS